MDSKDDRLSDTDVKLLKELIKQEKELIEARAQRAHYKKIFYESLIRWWSPIFLTAVLGVVVWTGKVWLLGLLEFLDGLKGH